MKKKNVKKDFSQKNWVGLTPGGGLVTSPPQKILGLELSKIIVSCSKRIFVQKRLKRVNHGGRVGAPPPPPVPKVVGLNCVVLFLVLLGEVAYKISDP